MKNVFLGKKILKENSTYNSSINSPLGVRGLCVLADDITGAAEIAGVCLRYGLKVTFGIDTIPSESEVRIIATDTRSLSESEAFTIHKNLALQINELGNFDLIYKKCDSVLRGYVLTEMLALDEVFQKGKILLEPTNPSTGRCIKNGLYLIAETLLHKTGFASDPDFPASTSSVQELIFNRTSLIHKNDHPEILISDCKSIEDLSAIASTCDNSVLPCGSAAFFEQVLIQKFKLSPVEGETKKIHFNKNYLFISGSTHPSGNDFREQMIQKECLVFAIPESLFAVEFDKNSVEKFSDELQKEFESHGNKLIVYVKYQGDILNCNPKTIMNVISTSAKILLKKLTLNDIFIDGGATAYDVFRTNSLKNFAPQIELAPGVVRLKSLDRENLFFTIKPGSYIWPVELFS